LGVKVIIPSAGSGKRVGEDIPKQYILLAGLPILAHTLLRFQRCVLVDEIILVVRKSEIAWVKDKILAVNNLEKVTKVVEGGAERQDSVNLGLQQIWDIPNEDEIVVVHDGARPFIDLDKINQCINEAQRSGACILGLKMSETIKRVNQEGFVQATVPAKDLWIAQTPQAFKFSLLKEAFLRAQKDNFLGTDEASLVERLPYSVSMIPGSFWNIKITYPEDLQRADRILKMGIVP
jgi:2-C-methyl-D-erythritol 4-phosphate cytidylyltransferase